MTHGLLTSKRNMEKIHKDYLKQRSNAKFNLYKQYRNIYNSVLRKSKKLTIEKKLFINKKQPKKIWQIYNELTTGNINNKKIGEIRVDGRTVSDDASIAEEFNKFLSSIGNKISNSIPSTNTSFDTFLRDKNPPTLNFESM